MELTLVLAKDYQDFHIWMGNRLIYWPGKKKPVVKKVGNGWQINDVEFRYVFDERSLYGKRGCRYTETERAYQNNKYYRLREICLTQDIKFVESN